jgi:hopene-associated glycosyltransferase HpnB
LYDATAARLTQENQLVLVTALAVIPLLIWIYLLGFRGRFWRISKHFAPLELPEVLGKRVAVVIPARNEAQVIGRALTSLLEQDFPARLHIFLVDDGSTDDTAEIAAAAAERGSRTSSLTIISGEPLIEGWTGKLWALSQGVAQAETVAPDYLLLTDADIVHGRDSVAKLVAIAETNRSDLTSYMVKLACISFAERTLIPAFVFFFLKLYPPAWIASQDRRSAAAAGGCILIRPEALKSIGGLAAMRNEVIDDCALAREVKRAGGRIWMGLTSTTESIRAYDTFLEIGRMISRTAFNQLQHSFLLLMGTVVGLAFTYILPVLLLLTGKVPAMILGLATLLLMTVAYLPTVRLYRQSIGWSLSLPLVACFYMAVTIHSALQYWRGQGGEWKGRVQDARS